MASVSFSLYDSVSRYFAFQNDLESFRLMNRAEVLTIMRVKQCFLLHDVHDETITFEDCRIEIRYRKYHCYIKLEYEDMVRERDLIWDEIDEKVKDYY